MGRSSAVCEVLPPLVAYSQDLPALAHDSDDPAIGCWLHVALCLSRIAQLPQTEQSAAFGAAADLISETYPSVHSEANASPNDDSDARRNPSIASALHDAAAGRRERSEWALDVARAVEAGAEYLEQRGAFRLAYSLLASLRDAIKHLGPADTGRILAQQGRVARQLGATRTADDHYRAAERIGRHAKAPEVCVRAVLGRGLMAATRGNYPEGRALFERGLRLAVRHRLTEHEAAAHNALLMSAVAAKDVDSALTHGWRLLQLSSGRTDRQAEVLVNLAAVALLADNAEAALAGSTEALRLTNDDRVLLAGFGSAATAAARLGRRDLLDRLASDVAHVLERSGHPYDRAYTLLEFADAYATVDSTAEARRFLADAVRLANEGPFFEVLHRAETVEQRVVGRTARQAASKATGAPTSPEPAAVLSTDRRAGLSLSAASHRVLQSLAELRS